MNIEDHLQAITFPLELNLAVTLRPMSHLLLLHILIWVTHSHGHLLPIHSWLQHLLITSQL
jgi:hypothetical protein